MSRPHASTPFESGLLAVVHEVGAAWHVVIASLRNGRPRLEDASTVVPADLAGHVARFRPERVICVLPASVVVCRTSTLPDADPEQLEQALRLQAEAHLLGSIAEHRVVRAVLPIAPGETSRSGIILSWPESGPSPAPPLDPSPDYAPDIAALAALLEELRPADPLLWLDRGTSAVALALCHAGGAVFRATREEAGASGPWAQQVTRVLAETALSVGHGASFAQALVSGFEPRIAEVAADQAALLLPAEVLAGAAGRIEGAPRDPAWWSDFGIASGLVLAAAGALAPLTKLIEAPVVKKPSLLEQARTALSRPRTAAIMVVSCLLVLALLPLAASAARLGLLHRRYHDIVAQTKLVEQTERRLAMYRALEQNAWSMTKLLSDVVSNTPVGIELESVRVQHSDASFLVRGLAKPDHGHSAAAVVAAMQSRLLESGIFGEVELNLQEPNNFGHAEFELSAKIVAPNHRPDYDIDRDFARWTLADRQQGKKPPGEAGDAGEDAEGGGVVAGGAAAETEAEAEPEPEPAAEANPPAGKGGGRAPRSHLAHAPFAGADSGGPGSRASLEDRGEGRGAGPGAVPPPLTKAQIQTMTVEEVRAHLHEVAVARNKLDREQDPELHQRLSSEFQMLLARLREFRE